MYVSQGLTFKLRYKPVPQVVGSSFYCCSDVLLVVPVDIEDGLSTLGLLHPGTVSVIDGEDSNNSNSKFTRDIPRCFIL